MCVCLSNSAAELGPQHRSPCAHPGTAISFWFPSRSSASPPTGGTPNTPHLCSFQLFLTKKNSSLQRRCKNSEVNLCAFHPRPSMNTLPQLHSVWVCVCEGERERERERERDFFPVVTVAAALRNPSERAAPALIRKPTLTSLRRT